MAAIDMVRDRIPCHALSNTNATHIEAVRARFPGLLERFGTLFASHELKMRKPEERLFRHVLESLGLDWEVVFVDDGSTDATLAVLKGLNAEEPRIKAISLSRNFGKEIAVAAGLQYAAGDAAVLMDADLQHPPELIADFVRHWRSGFDIVYGQRLDRAADVHQVVGFGEVKVFRQGMRDGHRRRPVDNQSHRPFGIMLDHQDDGLVEVRVPQPFSGHQVLPAQ